MATNPETIENLGFQIRRAIKSRSAHIAKKRFKGLYGAYPEVIFYVWNEQVNENII